MTEQTIKIYQIYHSPDLLSKIDPAFTPYDHCQYTLDNPELSNRWREWPIIRDTGLKKAKEDGADIWGFVSYKFQEKTNISGQQFVDFIRNNPHNDCWYMEPRYVPFNPFLNPWIQGDLMHVGISDIVNKFITIDGHKVDITKIPMPCCWYNFFAGTEKFWNQYFQVMDHLIQICKSNEVLNKIVFEQGAGHGNDPTVPYFIFIVERMFTTITTIMGMKAMGMEYRHNDFVVPVKDAVTFINRY